MLVKTFAAAVEGVNARTITVEVSCGGNVPANKPSYCLVGLPDNAVREGYQRIQAALRNNGFTILRMMMTINLAPADVRKEGSCYDLPIAVGILASQKQMKRDKIAGYMMVGELSLDGSLRPIRGALPIAIRAWKGKYEGLILPKANAREAAIVNKLKVYGIDNLKDAVDFLNGETELIPEEINTREEFYDAHSNYDADFTDVRGQENIKRALEIAAAGGHNAILIGPPGAGKTMLARRMPSILPPLSLQEALETTKIHSVAGLLHQETGLITRRPFRSPHHTISDVALVGGGSNPLPGEISLAHHGVLFLDELPEFKRSVLEVLRQPIEMRKVTISRAKISVDYPASFMLLASMNPCPCGYHNHPEKDCVCGPGIVKRYLNKISGPLMDRIDLHVEVTPVSYDELSDARASKESSLLIRERVMKARVVQQKRFESAKGIFSNAHMSGSLVREVCKIDADGLELLKTAMKRLQLSARAYDRILKVARTCADLNGSQNIDLTHLAEAIQYRSLDRENWTE